MALKKPASLTAVSDSDDERHETVGPRLAARPVVQQGNKLSVSRRRLRWDGGYPQGTPMWRSLWHTDHILRWSWPTWVSRFSKRTGNTWKHMAFVTLGPRWAWHLRGFAGPYWEKPWRRKWQPHSSPLSWKMPRTEEPGRLQSMGSLRVGHDWATTLHFTSLREVERWHARCHFESAKHPQGAWARRRPLWVMQMRMWADLWGGVL